MTIHVNAFRMKFPEFADQSDGQIGLAIQEAALGVDVNLWLDQENTDLGQLYLTAHHIMIGKMRAESANGNVIKSESMPGQSVTYAVPEMPKAGALGSAEDFTSTPYGVRYLQLLRKNVRAVAII